VARRAIVLLSGNLGSATAMAVAGSEGFELKALTFRLEARQEPRLRAARQLAARFEVSEHAEVEVHERPLTAAKEARAGEVAQSDGGTVPARGSVFLSFAVAWAEELEVDDLFLGVTADDRRLRPEASRAWIGAYERAANLATDRRLAGHRLQIHAPLIFLTPAQVVRRGVELGVDYSRTRNCQLPSADPCGRCAPCLTRLDAFAQNHLLDPAPARLARSGITQAAEPLAVSCGDRDGDGSYLTPQ